MSCNINSKEKESIKTKFKIDDILYHNYKKNKYYKCIIKSINYCKNKNISYNVLHINNNDEPIDLIFKVEPEDLSIDIDKNYCMDDKFSYYIKEKIINCGEDKKVQRCIDGVFDKTINCRFKKEDINNCVTLSQKYCEEHNSNGVLWKKTIGGNYIDAVCSDGVKKFRHCNYNPQNNTVRWSEDPCINYCETEYDNTYSLEFSKAKEGTVLEKKCNNNYSGELIKQCKNGKYITIKNTCKKNCYIDGNKINNGETFKKICDTDYSGEIEYYCSNGVLNEIKNNCSKNIKYCKKTTDELGLIWEMQAENTESNKIVAKKYEKKSQVYGTYTKKCIEGGEWDKTNKFEAYHCYYEPLDAYVNKNKYLELDCDNNLEGKQLIKCLPDGKFSEKMEHLNENKKCRITKCNQDITKINNIDYKWKESNIGTTISHECPNKISKIKRTCQENGKFSDINLNSCQYKKKECDSVFENGVNWSGKIGKNIFKKCPNGQKGMLSRRCNFNGELEEIRGSCSEPQCFKDGVFAYKGEIKKIKCGGNKKGYKFYKCNSDGKFVEDEFNNTCEELNCTDRDTLQPIPLGMNIQEKCGNKYYGIGKIEYCKLDGNDQPILENVQNYCWKNNDKYYNEFKIGELVYNNFERKNMYIIDVKREDGDIKFKLSDQKFYPKKYLLPKRNCPAHDSKMWNNFVWKETAPGNIAEAHNIYNNSNIGCKIKRQCFFDGTWESENAISDDRVSSDCNTKLDTYLKECEFGGFQKIKNINGEEKIVEDKCLKIHCPEYYDNFGNKWPKSLAENIIEIKSIDNTNTLKRICNKVGNWRELQ